MILKWAKKDVNVLVNATDLDYVPRYMKQPALMAPRILLAVSDDVATAAPTMTPTKLVQATELGGEKNA